MTDSTPAQDTALTKDQHNAANRKAIFAALRACGTTLAAVNYSGCCDSGGLDRIDIRLPNGSEPKEIPILSQYRESVKQVDGRWQKTVIQVRMPLNEAISDFALNAVGQRYGAWQNGDGAAGVVVFGVVAACVMIKHDRHFLAYEHCET